MIKTALITGSTDGIGKALAIALAQCGYTIHLLGRNRERGTALLTMLNELNPLGHHLFYQADLSTITGNEQFLKQYISEHSALNLLVLNANLFPQRTTLNSDGIDNVFMLCYLSRYLFSIRLEPLLAKGDNARILHIGGATYIKKTMNYAKILSGNNSPLTSIGYGFLACNLLVEFGNREGLSSIPFEFFEPGIVNTNMVKKQSIFIRILSKCRGMIAPEQAGEDIARHIVSTRSEAVVGKFYTRKGVKQPKKQVMEGITQYEQLLDFSQKHTDFIFTEK